ITILPDEQTAIALRHILGDLVTLRLPKFKEELARFGLASDLDGKAEFPPLLSPHQLAERQVSSPSLLSLLIVRQQLLRARCQVIMAPTLAKMEKLVHDAESFVPQRPFDSPFKERFGPLLREAFAALKGPIDYSDLDSFGHPLRTVLELLQGRY